MCSSELVERKSRTGGGLNLGREKKKGTAVPCPYNSLNRYLAKTEEGDLGAVLPAGFAVPEFDGFDHAAIAGEIDGTGGAAGGNAIADDEFFVRAVMKVDDDTFEEDFAAFDAQLDRAEAAVVLADVNAVVIIAAVNVGVAEVYLLGLGADGRECEREQKGNRCQYDSFEHVSSAELP
jgi:hypothetical protein